MKRLLYYSFIACGLLNAPVMAAPTAPISTTENPKELHHSAKGYTRYLTHALHLRGAQTRAVGRCTEAYLLALSIPHPVLSGPELAQQHYLQDMRGVLTAGQYSTFCWLQERERGADLADTNTKVLSRN